MHRSNLAKADFRSVDSVQLIVDSCGVPSGQIKKYDFIHPRRGYLNCQLSTFNCQLNNPLLSHQQHRDIIDIGAGGAGDNQAAAFLQGVVGVIVL